MDLPVTVTEQQPAHTDTEQASLYAKLQSLDVALSNLKAAGIMNKAEKAEIVITETRDTLGALALSVHALMNENNRLRADLEYFNRYGFQG